MSITLLTTGLLISQTLFARSYNWPGEARAYSLVQSSEGGYALAGFLWTSMESEFDFLVLKFSPTGEVQWAKTLGGVYTDYAFSIYPTSDGSYIVGGWGMSSGFPYDDFLLIKISSDGETQWAKAFGGQYHDFGWSVIQTSDGGFVFAGTTESFGAGNQDALIIKLSSSGEIQWAKSWGGARSEVVYSVIQAPDGSFVAAGETISFGTGGSDILILKLSSTGEILWARTYGGASGESAKSIIRTSDGGFAVVGWTYSFGSGGPDVLVVKLTENGNIEWARTFGSVGEERGFSIVETSDGGYAIAGHTNSFGNGSYDFLVLKTTSDGVLQWASTFGTSGEDHLFSIVQNPDQTYTAAGSLSSEGNFDPMLLKLNPDGTYPGCVQSCSFVQGVPSLGTTSPSAGANCSPGSVSFAPVDATTDPTVVDRCSPVEISERSDGHEFDVVCAYVPGGLLFISQADTDIRIYLADGRIAFCGKLERGRNRIALDNGVYFWESGRHKGRVVIR